MPGEFNIVVTDTSCFIILENIQLLDILTGLFGTVYTTPQIAREYGNPLPDWVVIKDVTDRALVEKFNQYVDLGEASAIALATEINATYMIIDDKEARKYADKIGMNVRGTLGLLIAAKQHGLISALKPYLEKIADTNFRVSTKLLQQLLKDAGE